MHAIDTARPKRRPVPTHVMLAKLISQVTQNIIGLSTKVAKGRRAESADFFRTAFLPLDGNNLVIALSAARQSGAAIASAWFACSQAAIDDRMIEDALGEMLNMTGALVTDAIGLSKALVPPQFASQGGAFAQDSAWNHHMMTLGEEVFCFSWCESSAP